MSHRVTERCEEVLVGKRVVFRGHRADRVLVGQVIRRTEDTLTVSRPFTVNSWSETEVGQEDYVATLVDSPAFREAVKGEEDEITPEFQEGWSAAERAYGIGPGPLTVEQQLAVAVLKGDRMPEGSKRLAYFDPAHNVFVVLDGVSVWAYRYRKSSRPALARTNPQRAWTTDSVQEDYLYDK
jgi:hypothetical protein